MLLPLLLLLLSPPPAAAAGAAAAASAYDALQSHGLPEGLLPQGVTSFLLDPSSGRFEASLAAPCTARFESDVHYNSSVAGTLSYGRIASLSGVAAQELFLWFPVLAIRVDVPSSGLVYFDVGGVVYKRFPLSLFDSPPACIPDADAAL